MAAFAHITSLLNTIHFHFLQPLPCLIFEDPETIKSLCEKIRYLQAFLEDSEKDKARGVLESEIRCVAQDAEAKIESQLYQLYLRCNQVNHPLKPPHSLYHTLKQVKRKIESIERRIIQIKIKSNNNLSAEPKSGNRIQNIKAGSFSQRSSEPKDVMVGCDDEFDTIMHKLSSNSSKLEVISIAGMGGIGKTTLARRVYEDESIISHFQVRAWATVSQEYNLKEILISLLDANGEDISDLPNRLRQRLMDQRYLIVIDDIWGTEAWDDLHRCFPENFNGSRILITTRLKQVADYASSVQREPDFDLSDMPRLRHVYLNGSFLNLPTLVQRNLQALSWLNLPDHQCLDLKKIPNVKELGIYIECDLISELQPGSLNGLANLHQLENLKIAASYKRIDNDYFRLLTALPKNLKKLSLYYTYLSQEDMGIIGTLPNLEILILIGHAFHGQEWNTRENEFCKLKYLQIESSGLKDWSGAHFPILECLILSWCWDLEDFPASFSDITCLRLITLTDCRSSLLNSAKRIQEERLSYGDDELIVEEVLYFYSKRGRERRSRRGRQHNMKGNVSNDH